MLQTILRSLLGCSHRRTTFPMTPRRGLATSIVSPEARKATYVVCLDCGQEFAYDWANMRVGQPVASRIAGDTAESAA